MKGLMFGLLTVAVAGLVFFGPAEKVKADLQADATWANNTAWAEYNTLALIDQTMRAEYGFFNTRYSALWNEYNGTTHPDGSVATVGLKAKMSSTDKKLVEEYFPLAAGYYSTSSTRYNEAVVFAQKAYKYLKLSDEQISLGLWQPAIDSANYSAAQTGNAKGKYDEADKQLDYGWTTLDMINGILARYR